MTDLVELSIQEVGHRLRRGEVTSLELTDAILAQIERTERLVHAYVHVYGDAAREAAREADRELATGRWRGPLHGIPVAIKDLLATSDAPTEAGSAALRGTLMGIDAAVVERLRAAGAIIVGKTVTHELAYGVNEPPTRSPWGEDAYPGGSSAGSGAALAARSTYGAIGTDTGGSIREPSSLNGLVGMKPTFGRVSRYGIVALSYSLDHAGPMTRTVMDNALMLGAISGYDPSDGGSIDVPVPDFVRGIDRGVRGMRIGIERDFFFGPSVLPEVVAAVDSLVAELQDAGAEVVDLSFPELHAMSTVGLTIMMVEASAEHRHLLRDRGDRLDPHTRVMLELGALVPGMHVVEALRARGVVQMLIRRLYEVNGLDALISPTLPTPTVPMSQLNAPTESGEDPLTEAINVSFPANVVGLPALTVPCGFSSDGLPIGAQIMGRPFDEPAVYRIARAYERNHDWAQRLPPLLR
jgi:aspartyl-tRNA(Asn)/glutamyl-tRNA(Gln) amidotransferase subunit A